MQREPDMAFVRILTVVRLNNSNVGNPRFQITFFDQDGSWTHNTKSNASCNYEVMNFANRREYIDVWLTKSGTVEYMRPTKQGTH